VDGHEGVLRVLGNPGEAGGRDAGKRAQHRVIGAGHEAPSGRRCSASSDARDGAGRVLPVIASNPRRNPARFSQQASLKNVVIHEFLLFPAPCDRLLPTLTGAIGPVFPEDPPGAGAQRSRLRKESSHFETLGGLDCRAGQLSRR